MQQQVTDLVELAMAVESQDEFDWGMVAVDEDATYRMLASGVLELYDTQWATMNQKDREMGMMAVITKLLVENFVLNIQQAKGTNI